MNVTLKDLLDAGVHYGHQLRRYNPKVKPYVYTNRHGVSIIDLEKTYDCLEKAVSFVEEMVASRKKILLVGTKRQAQEIIREAATACEMPFCSNRWMGGTLTNFVTIQKSIGKYKKYLEMESNGTLAGMPKKESSAIRHEMTRMQRNFEGITDMDELPSALFIVDIVNEQIAAAEANRLGIPIVAIVDTNSNPNCVQYPVPGNDDSTKSIRILTEVIQEAIQSGLAKRETTQMSKKITPIVRETTKEEQLPVTAPSPSDQDDSNEVPTSFSTDFDEESQ